MTFFAVDKREFCWEHRSLQHPDATSFPTRRRRSRQEIPRALRQMGGKGRSLLLAATVVFLLHAPLLVSCTDLDAHIYKGCANHIFCGGALPPTVAVLSSGLSLHAGSTKFYKTTTRPRWAPPPRSSSYCSVAGTCPAPIAPPASPAPCRHGATYPTPPFAAFLPSPPLPLLSHRCATPSPASRKRRPWMPRQSSSACSPAADPPHPWPAWAGGGRRGWVWRPWEARGPPPSSSGGHGVAGFSASSTSSGSHRAVLPTHTCLQYFYITTCAVCRTSIMPPSIIVLSCLSITEDINGRKQDTHDFFKKNM